MKTISVDELENIKNDLDDLEKDETIFFQEDGDDRYVLMTFEEYLTLQAYRNTIEDDKNAKKATEVRVISNVKNNLTYEEYEKIKEQLMDVFEKTFRPKPDKLN